MLAGRRRTGLPGHPRGHPAAVRTGRLRRGVPAAGARGPPPVMGGSGPGRRGRRTGGAGDHVPSRVHRRGAGRPADPALYPRRVDRGRRPAVCRRPADVRASRVQPQRGRGPGHHRPDGAADRSLHRPACDLRRRGAGRGVGRPVRGLPAHPSAARRGRAAGVAPARGRRSHRPLAHHRRRLRRPHPRPVRSGSGLEPVVGLRQAAGRPARPQHPGRSPSSPPPPWLAVCAWRRRPMDRWAQVWAAAGALFAFLWALLVVRHLFQGADMAGPGIGRRRGLRLCRPAARHRARLRPGPVQVRTGRLAAARRPADRLDRPEFRGPDVRPAGQSVVGLVAGAAALDRRRRPDLRPLRRRRSPRLGRQPQIHSAGPRRPRRRLRDSAGAGAPPHPLGLPRSGDGAGTAGTRRGRRLRRRRPRHRPPAADRPHHGRLGPDGMAEDAPRPP